LSQAYGWYDSKRRGLGNEFLDEIHYAVRLLEVDPERRPVYYRDFRRLITRRFPYKIFYRTEAGQVVVFRILHASRKHEWLLK
jgi:toxin ParE1/3/4